jgi:hypothetical protein
MPSINLNKRILDYIYECPVVEENPMYFCIAEERDNNNQLLPNREQPQDTIEYVDGTVERTYRAEILMYKSVAYDPIVTEETSSGKRIPSELYLNENLEDMEDGQILIDWIKEQNDNRHFPDFGECCIIESVETTSNRPVLNGVNPSVEPPLAQYSVGLVIRYLDITKQLWN